MTPFVRCVVKKYLGRTKVKTIAMDSMQHNTYAGTVWNSRWPWMMSTGVCDLIVYVLIAFAIISITLITCGSVAVLCSYDQKVQIYSNTKWMSSL